MSRLIALLAAGAGTATLSIGGFYLVRGVGGVAPTKDNPSETISVDLSFKTLQDFKTNHGGACAKKYFKNLSYGTTGNVIDTSHSIGSSDVNANSTEGGHPKSCLVINWERSDSQDTTTPPNNK